MPLVAEFSAAIFVVAVRLEIATALSRDVRVVPILLNEANLPEAEELPPDLRSMTRRQALRVDDTTFRADVGRLIEQLQTVRDLGNPHATTAGSPLSPPSQPVEDWRAEVVERTKNVRALRVRLSHSTHLFKVSIRMNGVELVELDGATLSRKTTLSSKPRRWQFTIVDGEGALPAVCDLSLGSTFMTIKELSLTVRDTVVYSEP